MTTTRIWRANVYGPDGCCVAWGVSQRIARERGQEYADNISGIFDPERDVHPVDLDMTRAGLVRWLNLHFDTDNG